MLEEVLEEVLVKVLVEVSAIQEASSIFGKPLEMLKLQHSSAGND